MLDMEMYTQMGYSQKQVRQAYDYHKKTGVDIFDAILQLQNKDSIEKQKKLQKNVPPFSYFVNSKSIRFGEYDIVYSRSGKEKRSYGRDELREANTPVGLLNVSNCCYLNSLLQCYFLMGAFTKEILSAEKIEELPEYSATKNKRIKSEYLLLDVLKETFAKLKLSSRRYIDPTPVLKNLVNSVGQKIQYGDEKDLNQINMQIVERLSECLIYTKKFHSKSDATPSKLKNRENIKQLFYGQKVEFIQGIEEVSVVDFMGIILNPKHGDILSAIDSELYYQVEVGGKQLQKHTFIRSLPKYLFFTMNLTEFEKKGNQLLKNLQKISFNFEIYLDQYLQKNREANKENVPKIKELRNSRNALLNQLNHLNLLSQKLQQCRVHAKYLQGWQEKFPNQSEFEQKRKSLNSQLQHLQSELMAIQSRQEKFVLMYLFVHRGDAISGHYWGYGRNGNAWYKFDVNCVAIKQDDILTDMEKAGGIPYALVYAKQELIQNFGYPYHTALVQNNLIDIEQRKEDYTDFIPEPLKKTIILQNVEMHASIQAQKNKSTVENVLKDYQSKFSTVKSQVQRHKKNQKKVKIPCYTNFACYLQSIGLSDFMKHNIFSLVLQEKAQITCKKLLSEEKLLKLIQNAFRKKAKKNMALKHFAIQCQPVESVAYLDDQEDYLAGKKCLQFIKLVYFGLGEWPKTPQLQDIVSDIVPILQKTKSKVFLQSLAIQVLSIMVLDLASRKQPIYECWIQPLCQRNSLLKQQLESMNAKVLAENPQTAKTSIAEIKPQQQYWEIDNDKKGFENEVIIAIRAIASKMEEGLKIYSINVQQHKVVKEEQKSDTSQGNLNVKSEQSEDLI